MSRYLPNGPRKPDPWRQLPRYVRRLHKLLTAALADGEIAAGRLVAVIVSHDAWCRALANKGVCNCNPSVGPIQDVGPGQFEELPVAQLVHRPKGR
jgi:hypothetical protein